MPGLLELALTDIVNGNLPKRPHLDAGAGNQVVISVADTGIGVNPDDTVSQAAGPPNSEMIF